MRAARRGQAYRDRAPAQGRSRPGSAPRHHTQRPQVKVSGSVPRWRSNRLSTVSVLRGMKRAPWIEAYVNGCRMRGATVLLDSWPAMARRARVIGIPFLAGMQRGDGDRLATLEAQQRRIHQVLGAHHDARIQVLHRSPADGPEIGGGGARQDGLHLHAGGGQFVPQRLAERQHEGLAAAIDAVQQFRRDGHDGRDVDDRAPAARHEGRRHGIGQPHRRGHVQIDHAGHLLHVALQQRRMRADAGVIHQQRDAGVFAQQILHPRQRGAVAQVGRQHLDRAACAC